MTDAPHPLAPPFIKAESCQPTGAGSEANPERIPHMVSTAAFDPQSVEKLTPEQERFYLASQWRMMWWRFRRHRLAVVSGGFLLLLYATILVSELLAPYNLHSRNVDFIFAPPQSLHFFDEQGRFVGPFVYGLKYSLNMQNLKREYSEDTSKVQPVRFFCRGDRYYYWGLIPGDVHLFCPA